MPRINPLLVLLAIGGVIWFVMRRGVVPVSVKSIMVTPDPLIRGTPGSVRVVMSSTKAYTVDVLAVPHDPTGTVQDGSTIATGILPGGVDVAVTLLVTIPVTAPAGVYQMIVPVAATGTTTTLVQGQQSFTVI